MGTAATIPPPPDGSAIVDAGEIPPAPDETPETSEDTGELTNDVGNKIIVPKKGESFADTMKRAVQYHKSLTPEQQQAAINKETATIPKKTAQTLGGAAAIGLAGPASLAAVGEAGAALPNVLPHTVEGVKAIGTWASKNPLTAYLLYNLLKELIPGAKKAIGIVKEAPE